MKKLINIIINNNLMISVLFFLSVIDSVFTTYLVCSGMACEINPFMNALLSTGLFSFLFVKNVVVLIVLHITRRFFNHIVIKAVSLVVVFVYTTIIINHINILNNHFNVF